MHIFIPRNISQTFKSRHQNINDLLLMLANDGLFPHDLSIVHKDVVDPFGIARDLPVGAFYQSILSWPLRFRIEVGVCFSLFVSFFFTSFLITFVILRKSLLFTSGPPAPAAWAWTIIAFIVFGQCKNHLDYRFRMLHHV